MVRLMPPQPVPGRTRLTEHDHVYGVHHGARVRRRETFSSAPYLVNVGRAKPLLALRDGAGKTVKEPRGLLSLHGHAGCQGRLLCCNTVPYRRNVRVLFVYVLFCFLRACVLSLFASRCDAAGRARVSLKNDVSRGNAKVGGEV